MKKIMLAIIAIVVIAAILVGLVVYKIMPPMEDKTAKSQLTANEQFSQMTIDTIATYCSENMLNQSEISIGWVDGDSAYFYGVERASDVLKSKDNRSSLFQIGSVSKVLTSTILARLVSERKVQLSDPVDQLLGYSLANNLSISLQSLSNHTSGLPRMPGSWLSNMTSSFSDQPYSKNDSHWMRSYLQNDVSISQDQRDSVSYSNIGNSILGFAMSQYLKMPYSELFHKYIFVPYGMGNSQIMTAENAAEVTPTIVKGEVKSLWNLNIFSPAGGIISSAEDMTKFIRAQFSNNPETFLTHQPTATASPKMDVGLGWFLIKQKSGDTLLFHNGSTQHQTSCVIVDVKNRKGLVLLSNTETNLMENYIDKLGFALMKSQNALK